MNVNIHNFNTLDFDSIAIQPEWNLPEKRENRMHSIHAYPAKFPAFITTKAIEKASQNGITVNNIADIFCGCGTVAFESVCAGRNFWGYDINPVATLIASTKSCSYDDCRIEAYYTSILEAFEVCQIDEQNSVYKNERINYWFSKTQIDLLLRLRTAIYTSVDNQRYLNFFLCAFSNILKPCSKWLTKSIKPQVDPNKAPKSPLEAFAFQINMMRKANKEIEGIRGVAHINTANFLEQQFDEPFIDLVVTSPPYVTSYEYADLHQLSTLWLGYTDDFKTFREGTIGSLFHSEDFQLNQDKLNKTGSEIVSSLAKVDRRKAKSVAQYYVDMQLAISKVAKMLNQNGACLFVIGNTEYKGIHINNAQHLVECLISEGFENIEVDRRKISNKILTPYRDANGKFASIAESSRKIYSEEFVIFAQK